MLMHRRYSTGCRGGGGGRCCIVPTYYVKGGIVGAMGQDNTSQTSRSDDNGYVNVT